MKKFIPFLILFLLFTMPFIAAKTVASLLSDYNKAKADYQEVRKELDECRLLDEDCEDIEEDILDPAVAYIKAGINLMLAYFDYVDDVELADEQATLEQALDDLKYVKTKEDFDEVRAAVSSVWLSAAPSIKLATTEALLHEVSSLVDTGKLIEAKLDCGVDKLPARTTALVSASSSFAARIAEAEKHIKVAEELFASQGSAEVERILQALESSQASLKDSQTALSSSLDVLETAGGKLCEEVTTVEEEEESEETADEESEEEVNGEETVEEETEEVDFDDLLEESGLESYYSDAEEAIENLIDYIEEQQKEDYDTTKADVVLAQAEAYLKQAEDTITKRSGSALSALFNAKNAAERGMYKDYYTKKSDSSSATADYDVFVTCMEATGYAAQRTACYTKYGISGGTQEDIESCLDTASVGNKASCYEFAEDEAQEQVSSEADVLSARVSEVEDDLATLEDDVEQLFNDLTGTDVDSDDADYQTIYNAIADLLDDVQGQNNQYGEDVDAVEDQIQNDDYDEAEDALDSLETEVEEYVNDIEDKIRDIENDIAVLS